MKALLISISAALALGGAFAAEEGATDHNGSRASRPPGLVLNQSFNEAPLNHKVWNRCHWWAERGCTIASNEELEWYLPGQVRVRNGRLRLTASRRDWQADGKTFPYISGMVASGPAYDSDTPKFAFRYGRAVIRARIPKGRGLWPAFWLLPADEESKPEIDVMEIYGQEPETVRMHFHYVDDQGEVQAPGEYFTDPALRRGWHRFAIDWRPGRLTWRVDGVRRWQITGDKVPDERMYLVLNLAVGGEGAGPVGPNVEFPKTFSIDYLRVWK